MSLRDEIPSHVAPIGLSQLKIDKQAEIALQTMEFLAKGGSVNVIPTGIGVDNMGRQHIRNEFNGTADYNARCKSATGQKSQPSSRSSQRSAYGQNIAKRGTKDNPWYLVVIGKRTHGSGKKWTHEQAIAMRDQIRMKLNLPAATY